jgi:hypothetical protein
MDDNQKEQPAPITSYIGNTESAINDAEKGKNSSATQPTSIETPVEVSTWNHCPKSMYFGIQLTSPYT